MKEPGPTYPPRRGLEFGGKVLGKLAKLLRREQPLLVTARGLGTCVAGTPMLAREQNSLSGPGEAPPGVHAGPERPAGDLTRHAGLALVPGGWMIPDGASGSCRQSAYCRQKRDLCSGDTRTAGSTQTPRDENFRTWLINLLSTQKWGSRVICQLSVRMSGGRPWR